MPKSVDLALQPAEGHARAGRVSKTSEAWVLDNGKRFVAFEKVLALAGKLLRRLETSYGC